MPIHLRSTLVAAVIGLTAVATLSAAVKFTSTFKSLDAGGTSFALKKVAALVISNDLGLRVPAEEALVRELNGRGMQAVATYRIAIGARLGHDPDAEKLGTNCLPILRARNLERELARCLCALGIGPQKSADGSVGLVFATETEQCLNTTVAGFLRKAPACC